MMRNGDGVLFAVDVGRSLCSAGYACFDDERKRDESRERHYFMTPRGMPVHDLRRWGAPLCFE